MKFIIEKPIFDAFPGTVIGIVIAKGITNEGENGKVQSMLRHEEERIRKNFTSETIALVPLLRCWQDAYRNFGAKPKEHLASVENLYRRVLDKESIRHINTLVDIYNACSLKYMVPVGGEDLDLLRGDIVLTFALAKEPPLLLLGDKEARAPHKGEVIYKDAISAICRRWNWREAERTKLTERTKNALLVIEGIPPVNREIIEQATRELGALVKTFCGGKEEWSLLDANTPLKEIEETKG